MFGQYCIQKTEHGNRDKSKECFDVIGTFTEIKEKENSEV